MSIIPFIYLEYALKYVFLYDYKYRSLSVTYTPRLIVNLFNRFCLLLYIRGDFST
jgi:hypothetical protein